MMESNETLRFTQGGIWRGCLPEHWVLLIIRASPLTVPEGFATVGVDPCVLDAESHAE